MISSTVGNEQAGDVLKEDPSAWSKKLIGAAGDLEEESGSVLVAGGLDPGSLSGGAEVLAGEASADEIGVSGGKRLSWSNVSDIAD